CLRLVTRFPERPLLSVPCLRSCIARSTFCSAFRPYFAIIRSLVSSLRLRGLGLHDELIVDARDAIGFLGELNGACFSGGRLNGALQGHGVITGVDVDVAAFQ